MPHKPGHPAKSQVEILKQKIRLNRKLKKSELKAMDKAHSVKTSRAGSEVSDKTRDLRSRRESLDRVKRETGNAERKAKARNLSPSEARKNLTKSAKGKIVQKAIRTEIADKLKAVRNSDINNLPKRTAGVVNSVSKRLADLTRKGLRVAGKLGINKLSGMMVPKVNPVGLRKKQAQKKGGS